MDDWPKPADPNRVRGRILLGGFILRRRPSDGHIIGVFVAWVEVGGSIPNFIVKQVQTKQPMTLAAIKKLIDTKGPVPPKVPRAAERAAAAAAAAEKARLLEEQQQLAVAAAAAAAATEAVSTRPPLIPQQDALAMGDKDLLTSSEQQQGVTLPGTAGKTVAPPTLPTQILQHTTSDGHSQPTTGSTTTVSSSPRATVALWAQPHASLLDESTSRTKRLEDTPRSSLDRVGGTDPAGTLTAFGKNSNELTAAATSGTQLTQEEQPKQQLVPLSGTVGAVPATGSSLGISIPTPAASLVGGPPQFPVSSPTDTKASFSENSRSLLTASVPVPVKESVVVTPVKAAAPSYSSSAFLVAARPAVALLTESSVSSSAAESSDASSPLLATTATAIAAGAQSCMPSGRDGSKRDCTNSSSSSSRMEPASSAAALLPLRRSHAICPSHGTPLLSVHHLLTPPRILVHTNDDDSDVEVPSSSSRSPADTLFSSSPSAAATATTLSATTGRRISSPLKPRSGGNSRVSKKRLLNPHLFDDTATRTRSILKKIIPHSPSRQTRPQGPPAYAEHPTPQPLLSVTPALPQLSQQSQEDLLPRSTFVTTTSTAAAAAAAAAPVHQTRPQPLLQQQPIMN